MTTEEIVSKCNWFDSWFAHRLGSLACCWSVRPNRAHCLQLLRPVIWVCPAKLCWKGIHDRSAFGPKTEPGFRVSLKQWLKLWNAKRCFKLSMLLGLLYPCSGFEGCGLGGLKLKAQRSTHAVSCAFKFLLTEKETDSSVAMWAWNWRKEHPFTSYFTRFWCENHQKSRPSRALSPPVPTDSDGGQASCGEERGWFLGLPSIRGGLELTEPTASWFGG